jgi:hypothetical protein
LHPADKTIQKDILFNIFGGLSKFQILVELGGPPRQIVISFISRNLKNPPRHIDENIFYYFSPLDQSTVLSRKRAVRFESGKPLATRHLNRGNIQGTLIWHRPLLTTMHLLLVWY